jgi:hypothetical protein
MTSSGEDGRRIAPHVSRNAEPIVDVLRPILPDDGLVLEIASGSGEHALHFARAFPHLVFQPSDPDPTALASIEAWRRSNGTANLLSPVALDVAAKTWPVDRADVILCINMVHISPWAATKGLMAGAGRLLAAGAPLYLYGAYRRQDAETAPSNLAFDASLRSRNPGWGVRDLADVVAEAKANGLFLENIVEMPANNLSILFRRSA